MTDDKKPSRFEELMRGMGRVKQFPIDLQPVNPAAPLEQDIAPSKELQEIREEEVTAEPSLAGLMPDLDLTDPKVKSFFADLLAEIEARKDKKE